MSLTPAAVGKRIGRNARSVRGLIAKGRMKAKRDRATGLLYVAEEEVARFEAEELGDYEETKDRARRPRRKAPIVPEVASSPPIAPEAADSTADPPSGVEVAPSPPISPLTGSTPEPEPAAPTTPHPAPSKPTPPPKKGGGWTLFG